MSDNKVRYGLKNAHYAVASMSSSGELTYGTVKPLDGDVSISLEPQGESVDFYASDGDFFSRYANNGYEGSLELALIPDTFLVDCLGMKVDSDGLIVESSNDTPKYFALLFEFTGDEKAIRHCLYYCQASRPNQEGDTKGETIEVKTEELSFKSIPIPGTEVVKAKSSVSTNATRYNSWYTSVALPNFQS